MEENFEENANPSKLQELLQEFYKLEGNNMPENRKRLNHYIIKIKEDIQDDQELNNFTKMIKTKDIMQQKLKIEILLQLRRDDQLLQILKEADSISTAKITTNLTFLSDVFSKMKCEDFFKTVAPFIPFSATEKIINRLGKVLSDEILAEEYFDAVRLNYGLHLAKAILPACRINFAKRVIEVNKLRLTSRELLRFASKDKTFLKFYFDMLWKYEIGVSVNKDYIKVIEYVGKTDADLFWELQLVYKFKTCCGKSVFDFLFSKDPSRTTHKQNFFKLFRLRSAYRVLKKRKKLYVLLANLCEGDEDIFCKMYFEYLYNDVEFIYDFLRNIPDLAYSDFHKAYEFKFGKNLLDNTKLFDENWLRRMSCEYREIVLDVLIEENPNLYYLYNLEKSIPLLKDKLENDIGKCEFYLRQMYQSCVLHKNEDVLFEILIYILQKHRDKLNVMDDVTATIVEMWPKSEGLKSEIWEVVDEMITIILFSDEINIPSATKYYNEEYLIRDVNKVIPFNNLHFSLFKMRISHHWDVTQSELCYENMFYFFNYIQKIVHETQLLSDMYSIFSELVSFNNHHHLTLLLNYGNFIEACGIYMVYWFEDIIKDEANSNAKNSYFSNFIWIRSYDLYDFRVPRFIEANLEIYLKNISLDTDITTRTLSQVRWNCIDIKIKQALSNYCLTVLQIKDYDASRVNVVSKLLLKINETTFLDIFMKTIQIGDSQVWIETGLTQIKNIFAIFPICLKLYEEVDCQKYQTAVLRCLQQMPLYQSKKTINNLSESPLIRLRKLSVAAAGMLLMNEDLVQFISQMNAKETDPDVMRKLCRRSFHLFIKDQNDLHWTLLKRNINLSGCESGFISRFWWELRKISPEYLEKFVSYTFSIIIKEESANKWTKTLAMRLNSRPILENLNTAFVQNMMKSLNFNERRTDYRYKSFYADNYHLEFIFLTSGEKQTTLLEYTFEQLKEYKEKNWNDFPPKSKFDKVYDFAMTFCVFALKSKSQNGIVNKFCSEWRLIFPPDTHPEFLMLEFLGLFFECKCEVGKFCKKSNKLMRDYIAKYGEMVLHIYSEELMKFIRVAKISKMNFFTSFMHSKPDRLSYCAILKMLPWISWTKCVRNSKLITLMECFRLDIDLSVRLHYSHYLFTKSSVLRD